MVFHGSYITIAILVLSSAKEGRKTGKDNAETEEGGAEERGEFGGVGGFEYEKRFGGRAEADSIEVRVEHFRG
jgi:hypothetical protein